MISKYFFDGFGLLRPSFVALSMNGILKVKLGLSKEGRRFHTSPLSSKSEHNLQNESLRKLKTIKVWTGITAKEVATAFNIHMNELRILLPHLKLKPNDQIQELTLLKFAAKRLGYTLAVVANPEKETKALKQSHFQKQPPSKPENLIKRPPVVTVMGHVDHGKTTLLDSLRNSFVVQQEFGGITQHIGAFSVKLNSGDSITFIDTPGHAAFTAMRSRGTEVTDLVILVIALDDGIMEQTVESIKIANAAKVPMIVAVNKIDKPSRMKIEDIKQKLLEEGIQIEDQGGEVQVVPISALKKINLDLLIETVLLQAEIMNLKGDPTGLVEGVIIESKKDKLGILATVIIKRGTLTKGKILVAGNAFAKVRRMLDENGNDYKEALPSTPVQIFGWKELPVAGEEAFEVTSEKKAKMIIDEREKEASIKKILSDKEFIEKKVNEHREEHIQYRTKMKSFKNWQERRKFYQEYEEKFLRQSINTDEGPHLKIILKGDVYGTLEVLLDVFDTYDKEDECKLSVADASVGDIKQSDIEKAEAFNAIIYAFNVSLNPTALELLKDKNIDIRYHNVIYKLIDDVKEELTARLPLKDEEEINGEAEVLQNFLVTKGKKKIPVAGARCIKGQLKKESLYRILRNNEVIYEGNLAEMKNEKKVVKSIPKGMECGLMFESFPDKFNPGDKIICYDIIKVSQTTTWDPGF